MRLTPGVRFLVPYILGLAVLCAVTKVVSYAFFDKRLRWWIVPLFLPIALIVYATLSDIWRSYRIRRKAERLGAVLPPVLKHRLPGNLEALFFALRNHRSGVLGALRACSVLFTPHDALAGRHMTVWKRKCGNIINLRIMWDDKVRLLSPFFLRLRGEFFG
jgi:hypothetical protein